MTRIMTFLIFLLFQNPFGMSHADELISVKGRLLDEKGKPLQNFRIEVFGYGSSTITTATGKFWIELPREVRYGFAICLKIMDSGWKIKYPENGVFIVSRDTTFYEEFRAIPVEGENWDERFLTEIFKKIASEIESIKYINSEKKISAKEIQEIIEKSAKENGVEVEKLKERFRREGEKKQFYSKISALFPNYISNARDVRTHLETISLDFAYSDSKAAQQLTKSIEIYNVEAYAVVNNNKLAYRNEIVFYWNDPVLADTLYNLMTGAIEKIHKPFMYPLKDIIELINRINRGQIKKKNDLNGTKADIKKRTSLIFREFNNELDAFERSTEEYLLKLQTADSKTH